MPVNSTNPEYDGNPSSCERIRDVLRGDAAIKHAGDKYVPRLDSQSDSEFEAYAEYVERGGAVGGKRWGRIYPLNISRQLINVSWLGNVLTVNSSFLLLTAQFRSPRVCV